jgi:hypothetical protein
MIKTVAEYRELADECRKLAAKMPNPNEKKSLLLIAAAWDTVAEERESPRAKK